MYQRDCVYTFDLVYFLRRDIKNLQSRQLNPQSSKRFEMARGVSPRNLALSQRKDGKTNHVTQKIRGIFESDPGKMYNTKDKSMVDYLISKLDVVSDTEIIFREQEYDPLSEIDEQNEGRSQLSELPPDDQLSSANLMIEPDGMMMLDVDEKKDTVPEPKKDSNIPEDTGLPNTIVSNLVDYQHKKDDESGCEYIYNVVYTGKRPMEPSRDANRSLIESRQVAEVQDEAPEEKNTIKIHVDLAEVKKLYPTIDLQQEGLMKSIGIQLIDGIKLDSRGEIVINKSKINPQCIKIQQKKVDPNIAASQLNSQGNADKPGELSIQGFAKQLSQTQPQMQSTLQQMKNEKKVVLMKSTRFYEGNKYLVLIYEVERKLDKIMQQSKDSVFEEFEITYQINFINLSNKLADPLVWEVTSEELNQLSVPLTSSMKRAQYIMKNIQVFSSKFIFVVEQKSDVSKILPKPNLVVIYSKGFLPIQLHFKNRKYKQNYKQYTNLLQQRKLDVLFKLIPQEWIKMKQYVLIVGFNEKKTWHFIGWDIVTYQRFNLEKDIDKSRYEAYFNSDKEIFIQIVQRHFSLDFQK